FKLLFVFLKCVYSYLIEDCVNQKYTHNSCEKVFCEPWQKCVRGACVCKLPYQCPKNGTMVCSSDRMKFPNYCSQKSFECRHRRSKFSFHIFLDSGNASFEGSGFKPSEGMVQVKVNQFQKTFLCGHGWTINEANVACRDLGFPAGAVSTEAVVPSNLSSECITATCRGIEMTLAECALTRLNQTSLPLAKVVMSYGETCFPGEFLCVNRKCIPSEKTCDGIDDCGDLSDEVCCRACRAGSFHCHSDVCIPESYRCNNEKDCLTGEDESRRFSYITGITLQICFLKERRKFKTFLPQLHCGILNRTVTRRKRILGGFTAEKVNGKKQVKWLLYWDLAGCCMVCLIWYGFS
uniref:SRCR domain-containing protein n=1 Tax=Varanus komodoensis TaxID=61221 RepID=A0A8D2Q1X4_VARKO